MVTIGTIDGGQVVNTTDPGDIHVTGKIDGASLVDLESTAGSITIDGKIDGGCNVTLKAAKNVIIGTQGDEGDKKIDGGSHVDVVAGGDIVLGSYIHQSTVDFSAHGAISMTGIDGSAQVRQLADGDVSITGKIDGDSRVELTSNRGSVMVDGKIDGGSKVSLTAGRDIRIGLGQQGGDEDRKIDGNSFVTASAGGLIALGGGIFKDHTAVDLAACGSVSIAKGISGGAAVRILSGAGSITVADPIADSATHVTSWPKGALTPTVEGGATVDESAWASPEPLCVNPPRAGYWWENWSQTYGYVAPFRVVPRSLDDIVNAIIAAGNVDDPDPRPVKAVGGGWSFTDASLPFKTQAEVDQVSIQRRGVSARQGVRGIMQGLHDATAVPMDFVPGAINRDVAFSSTYAQPMLRRRTDSGAELPASVRDVILIDTRSLASSLQCELDEIQAPSDVAGRPPGPEILFHVEAGITMADLQQLLDHQHPRLALQASGGSPGATLAGVLSSATHGGEFAWPLLVDQVRAIHLVGPGGVQWWIEGDVPVASQPKLQLRYPKLDPGHFIGGAWNGISGLSAQDVLNAVTVSMGTMGVIYSVVLAVVPQYGLQQIVHATTWQDLLGSAKTSESDLRAASASANQAVLDHLIDGGANGTGIPKADNVYVDLAINPLNLDCWIVNRQRTFTLPDDPNSPSPTLGDYLTKLSQALSLSKDDIFMGSRMAGRLFDFLEWHTDVPGFVAHDAGTAAALVRLISSLPDPLVGALATASAQGVLNQANNEPPDRGHQFLGDVLSAFFHALEGTKRGVNSDMTAVSYKVGAIGWPEGGLPGRGLEIALDPTNAFTFLQTVLLDDVLATTMSAGNRPLFGYVSVRVCPPTKTLVGMQQYAPLSVMVEVVAYRSPEANAVMDLIQAKAIGWGPAGPKPLLHWGLENDQVSSSSLAATPLGQPYKGTLTRLDAFKQVRDYLKSGNAAVFDNNFSARIGL